MPAARKKNIESHVPIADCAEDASLWPARVLNAATTESRKLALTNATFHLPSPRSPRPKRWSETAIVNHGKIDGFLIASAAQYRLPVLSGTTYAARIPSTIATVSKNLSLIHISEPTR